MSMKSLSHGVEAVYSRPLGAGLVYSDSADNRGNNIEMVAPNSVAA
jgi:hypothetical protein